MNRRGFLSGMLAVGVAPAIITSRGVLGAFTPAPYVPNVLQGLVDFARAHAIKPCADGNYYVVMGRNVFAQLTPEQKRLWAADVWSRCRDNAFLPRFLGGPDAPIITPQDDRYTVAPPNAVLALPSTMRVHRAG